MRILPSILTLLALSATPALAQDPAKVASGIYKVIAENARVRVLRATLPPGSKAAMHEHPPHVAVALAGGTVDMTFPDGKTANTELKTEGALMNPAGKHATANPGTSPIDVVLVELKTTPGTAALPTSRPGMKMAMLLEDPRVIAYRVSFEPTFSEAAGTTHDYDQVVIPLGTSDISLTMDGKTISSWKRGDVTLIGRGVAHATKQGKQSGDMIIVAIK